jgi:hypothetical protein
VNIKARAWSQAQGAKLTRLAEFGCLFLEILIFGAAKFVPLRNGELKTPAQKQSNSIAPLQLDRDFA